MNTTPGGNQGRGSGTTPSERYLSWIATQTFLSMWSFPNLYTNEGRSNNKGDGKELCDLLAIFGNSIFIFSDKNCEFPEGPTPEIAWSRWYRRAVEKSVRQVIGAHSWICRFPERIFLDKSCQIRFPLAIPDSSVAQFHLIVVTRGAYPACKSYFGGESTGSLMMNTEIIEDMHEQCPFTIGRVRATLPYIHVFDELTLNVVLKEFDTIRDLSDYLNKKEIFLTHPNRYVSTTGEEQLVAMYLKNMNGNGQHDFVEIPDHVTHFFIEEGLWENFIKHPQYLAKKQADKESYAWDKLIEHFTSHGLTEPGDEEQNSIARLEPALRVLASEPRLARRQLSRQLVEALSKEIEPGKRFLRVGYSQHNDDTAYVFLILPIPPYGLKYAQYREARQAMLLACCKVLRLRIKTAKQIIGFASEPKGDKGSSEDLVFIDCSEDPWTLEAEEEAKLLQNKLGILLEGQARQYRLHEDEFPDSP